MRTKIHSQRSFIKVLSTQHEWIIDKSAEHCGVIEPKYNNKNEPNAGIKACHRNVPVHTFFLLSIFAPLECTAVCNSAKYLTS